MDHSDPDRSLSIEKDIEKLESEDEEQDENEWFPLPSQPPRAKVREPTVHDVPSSPDTDVDIEKGFVRGREGSASSASSGDSKDSDARRTGSKSQSIHSVHHDAEIVPMEERRGSLARLSVIAEVRDPYEYSRRMKWILTTIVALAASAAPMGSSIVLPGLKGIVDELHTTRAIANLSVALYMLAMGIFPLWWSSFSETLGRRNIYLVSFSLFAVFNVVAARSINIHMFVVLRLLAGGAAASVQAVGAGTIADIWEVKERGRAMSLFYLGPMCGPLIAPILGGVLAETLGWRSAMYFLAIFGACLVLMIVFCLPETLQVRNPVAAQAESEAVAEVLAGDEKTDVRLGLTRTTTQQSIHIKSRKYLAMARRTWIDPLRIVLLLQFPSVALCVMYASVTFASTNMLNISVQRTFSRPPYNYTEVIVGLLYLPNSVGFFITSLFGGRWVDRIMHREARKAGRYDADGKLQFLPEDRMQENVWLAAVLYPCALLVYGWTARETNTIAGPMVANFFFGIGSMLIFSGTTTMLTEFMPRKASNGVALNNFVRNICACVLIAVTEPLINALGDGWLFTIVALVAMSSGFFTLWAMKRYGNQWRVSMDSKLQRVMGD